MPNIKTVLIEKTPLTILSIKENMVVGKLKIGFNQESHTVFY
jgi:hypothetical protein